MYRHLLHSIHGQRTEHFLLSLQEAQLKVQELQTTFNKLSQAWFVHCSKYVVVSKHETLFCVLVRNQL